MLDRETRPLVLAAVGVALLLNPLYLFPGGVPAERTYSLQAERPEPLESAILSTGEDRIYHCASGSGPHGTRICVFESLVGPNGTFRLGNQTLSAGDGDPSELAASYEFVYYSGNGFYEPRASTNASGVTLSLEPVTARTVADAVAIPYGGAPESVQRAVETGSASATVGLSPNPPYRNERTDALGDYLGTVGQLVERNGTYYRVTSGVTFQRAFPVLWLTVARLLAVFGGLAMLAGAMRRQRVIAGSE